jgi:hypothetical protein
MKRKEKSQLKIYKAADARLASERNIAGGIPVKSLDINKIMRDIHKAVKRKETILAYSESAIRPEDYGALAQLGYHINHLRGAVIIQW